MVMAICWTLWFAWYPVTVDAYKASEIHNGSFRRTVWMRYVEWRPRDESEYDQEYDGPHDDIRYRLPQKDDE